MHLDVMYHVGVHLLYASLVAAAAWLLTATRRASATTKYWIWVVTAVNFVVPSGALIDKFWTPDLAWSAPLHAVLGVVRFLIQARSDVVLLAIWITGVVLMLGRLIVRVWREHREVRAPAGDHDGAADFIAGGIPVRFASKHQAPAVGGVFSPRILLPAGIERLLRPQELNAVLLHELVHARRRDNLIRLFYEVSLCVLWFHPLLWLVGRRMRFYCELSCDESVVRNARGRELVSALAKLAAPEQAPLLQAQAASHIVHRLERLVRPAQAAYRGVNVLLTVLFSVFVAAGIFGTVAHTVCCFMLKH